MSQGPYPGSGVIVRQPGTYTTRKEDEGTELRLPLKLGAWGILATDLAIFFVMVGSAILGWLTVPVVVALVMAGLWWYLVKMDRIRERDESWTHVSAGIFMALALFVAFPLGEPAWEWLSVGGEAALNTVRAVLGPLAELPPWIWWSLFALWALVSFRGKEARAWVISVIAVGLATWTALTFDRKAATQALDLAWARLRWILLPYMAPPVVFGLGLAAHNFMEMLIGRPWPPDFGRIDWTAVGLRGLFWPMSLHPKTQPSGPWKVRAEMTSKDGKVSVFHDFTYIRPIKLQRFCQAMVESRQEDGTPGVTFTERRARKHGAITRLSFRRLRADWIQRKWATWEGKNNPAELTENGWVIAEALANEPILD